jgi:hypothetical protein
MVQRGKGMFAADESLPHPHPQPPGGAPFSAEIFIKNPRIGEDCEDFQGIRGDQGGIEPPPQGFLVL